MRGRAVVLTAILCALAATAPVAASTYGAGRFRAVQIRLESEDVVAIIQGVVGEGGDAALDLADPWAAYEFSAVCAIVYTDHGHDEGCGQGGVSIAWPLLEAAAISAHVGAIDIDLVVIERGLPRTSPMLEIGLGSFFAHGGLLTFRPGHATGSISSPKGSVIGETDMVGLYSLTSVYGVPF